MKMRLKEELILLFAIASLIPLSAAKGQMPDGTIDRITDQTLLVASIQNNEGMGRWVSLLGFQMNIDGNQLGEGQVTAFLSATEARLVLNDPTGQRMKTFEATNAAQPLWKVDRQGNQTVLTREIMPGANSQTLPPDDRCRWSEALASVGSEPLAIVVAPGAEIRRVVTELALAIPQQPGQKQTAEQIKMTDWFTTVFDQGEKARFSMTVQATSDEAVGELATILASLPDNIADIRENKAIIPGLLRILLNNKPEVEGKRITFNVSGDESGELGPFLAKMLGQQQFIAAVQQVKILVLAMHNYEGAFKEFPSIVGKGEARGLSWRVGILPYVDEMDLYNQFRMDEPWDSEHNKALIPKMPRMFLHPASGLTPSDGRSSFSVPTGPGLAYRPGEPCLIADFRDGTSNSVLVMTVNDEHAEVWTKPVVTNFDPLHPRKSLMLSPLEEYLFGRCDGSVDLEKNTLSDDMLRAVMTINGGETIVIDE